MNDTSQVQSVCLFMFVWRIIFENFGRAEQTERKVKTWTVPRSGDKRSNISLPSMKDEYT